MSYLTLQTALKAAGFDPGPLDGKWGGKTLAALMAYATGKPATFVITTAAAAMVGPMIGKDITTPLRIVHFLAQLAHESTGFARLNESLNYSVEGLLTTFKRYRISAGDAQALGRIDKVVGGKKTVVRAARQSAIANLIYGGSFGRKQLGNVHDCDGAAYIGRGFIMITGRANYKAYGDRIGLNLIDHPEEAAVPDVAGRLAVDFWAAHNLNALADADDIERITLAVNGGDNGLDDRKAILARLKRICGL